MSGQSPKRVSELQGMQKYELPDAINELAVSHEQALQYQASQYQLEHLPAAQGEQIEFHELYGSAAPEFAQRVRPSAQVPKSVAVRQHNAMSPGSTPPNMSPPDARNNSVQLYPLVTSNNDGQRHHSMSSNDNMTPWSTPVTSGFGSKITSASTSTNVSPDTPLDIAAQWNHNGKFEQLPPPYSIAHQPVFSPLRQHLSQGFVSLVSSMSSGGSGYGYHDGMSLETLPPYAPTTALSPLSTTQYTTFNTSFSQPMQQGMESGFLDNSPTDLGPRFDQASFFPELERIFGDDGNFISSYSDHKAPGEMPPQQVPTEEAFPAMEDSFHSRVGNENMNIPSHADNDAHGISLPQTSVEAIPPATTQPSESRDSRKMSCPVCHQVFRGEYCKGNLNRHIRNFHSRIAIDGNDLKCRECLRPYQRRDARRKHEWKIHKRPDCKPNKRKRV